jgi:dolichyl-phosphate-mannose-protein mannosyltransferase
MASRESLIPRWSGFDTIAISSLVVVALVSHLWRLGVPNQLVYDERIYVDEALRYLHGGRFFEVHPPLAILLIAGCLRLFGCHSWSWRLSSALIGAALVPITYLLARRLFHTRGAAAIAALLVLCEGMFLEYSRLGLINILYLTLGAASYLMAFRFVQSGNLIARRRSLVLMGILLGLCLGSKLAIPVITWLLAVGFVVWSLGSWYRVDGGHAQSPYTSLGDISGVVALVGGLSAVFFLVTFFVNYRLGWWSGLSALKTYYGYVAQANLLYPSNPDSHQDSPWWSWPLLLRPYLLWTGRDDYGRVETIWGGGNPVIWWGALVAIVLCAVRAVRRDGTAWIFLSLGYLMYSAMWIPIHRALYVYSYLPALYLGVLALGGMLDLCWNGKARAWEEIAILIPAFAACFLGLGYLTGAIASLVTLSIQLALVKQTAWSGRFTVAVFLSASIAVFFYFLPLWLASPLSSEAFIARMWFNHAHLGNWI